MLSDEAKARGGSAGGYNPHVWVFNEEAVERIATDAARAAERALVKSLSQLAEEWESEAEAEGKSGEYAADLRAALRPEAATTEGAVACACPYTDPSTWLSAASCGYGSGYEPGSTQEWNPDCLVHLADRTPPLLVLPLLVGATTVSERFDARREVAIGYIKGARDSRTFDAMQANGAIAIAAAILTLAEAIADLAPPRPADRSAEQGQGRG